MIVENTLNDSIDIEVNVLLFLFSFSKEGVVKVLLDGDAIPGQPIEPNNTCRETAQSLLHQKSGLPKYWLNLKQHPIFDEMQYSQEVRRMYVAFSAHIEESLVDSSRNWVDITEVSSYNLLEEHQEILDRVFNHV